MAAHRTPRWTREEVAILREHYPEGGLKAVLEKLPHRTWHAIHMKAQKLGIKCERKHDGGRRFCLTGDQLAQAIRLRENEGWSFAKIGAHLGRAEATVTNAVIAAQCVRQGYTPAERFENGRLAPAGIERLRWMLKKGLKGVEIQLRLGVSASMVAEQRRRYNAELKEKGKAPLPPPGAGQTYSGVRVPAAKKREVEQLFLEGFGSRKISELTGVSNTVCVRVRSKLVKRLRRDGKALPGCDLDGKRHVFRDHARHIPDELKAKLCSLLLQRVPVRRAAKLCGIGSCSAYQIRDAFKAEGVDIPKPRLPGKTKPLQRQLMTAGAIPDGYLWRFRELVREHGDEEARRLLRVEISEARRSRSFEDTLKLVAQGQAKVVAVQRIVTAGPDCTLGGVTGAII